MAQAAFNCPFCGSEHLHVHHTQSNCYVHCDTCESSGPHQQSVKDAISQWNHLCSTEVEHRELNDLELCEMEEVDIGSRFEHLQQLSRVAALAS